MEPTHSTLTAQEVRLQLSTVLDPEIGVDIVSMGLIYDISISSKQTSSGVTPQVHILMTLTTPGCPLAPAIEDMIRQALDAVEGIDGYGGLTIEITFDPPWTPDMMDPEIRAQLGLD